MDERVIIRRRAEAYPGPARAVLPITCWQCGVEPLTVHETTTLSDPQPTYIAGRWPDGDHAHAERAPSPGELEQAGHEALMRIRSV
jgi:hypothetical protein